MAQMSSKSKSYQVSAHEITILGLYGSVEGPNWVLGILVDSDPSTFDENGNPSYLNIVGEPSPVMAEVMDVIDGDIAAGKDDQIAWVLLSNKVAVRLFLEGYLTANKFIGAKEITMDTSGFVPAEVAGEYPCVWLQEVQFGSFSFPVGIMSELHVGSNTAATMTEGNTIV